MRIIVGDLKQLWYKFQSVSGCGRHFLMFRSTKNHGQRNLSKLFCATPTVQDHRMEGRHSGSCYAQGLEHGQPTASMRGNTLVTTSAEKSQVMLPELLHRYTPSTYQHPQHENPQGTTAAPICPTTLQPMGRQLNNFMT